MKINFRNFLKPKRATEKLSAVNAQAKLQEGLALHQLGQLTQAQSIYRQVLKMQPEQFDALHLLGVIALQTNNHSSALELIGKAIAVDPNIAAVYSNLGLALRGLNRLDEALANCDKAIQLDAQFAEAYCNRGVTLHQLKRFDEALSSYDHAIKLKADFAEAYLTRGITLHELKRFDEALSSYDQAITLKTDHSEAHNNRGVTLKELKRLEEALASYDQAIMYNANHIGAYFNRAITLKELRRFDEALASYDHAIRLKADYAEAYYNRGIMLHELKRLDEALASQDQAIGLKGDFVEAYISRGNVLQELKRLDEALASLDQAIRLKGDFAEAYYNRGNVLHELGRLDEALVSYDHAIQIKADYAAAYNNRAFLLVKLRKLEEAVQSFARLLEVAPAYSFAEGQLLHAKMLCCDWGNVSELADSIKRGIAAGRKAAEPFGYQAVSCSEQDLRCCAEIFAADRLSTSNIQVRKKERRRSDKIRIGYLSGEFREQATAILMTELWELHDKNRFEIFAFDNGWDDGSARRARINSAFSEILDIRRMSDADAATLIRAKGIDILIDLNGYFGEARQGILRNKPSPIQVNYLGFPGTMGVDYIDYLIADKIVIPEESRQHYSEKIVYLPNSYQANDRHRKIEDQNFSREELGLPPNGFVFCCFNNNYKITPDTFDVWMSILRKVDGSLLWLLEDNPLAANNLHKEAHARGVGAERLIFARRLPLAEHLARHRAADLFIDTFPYNAHTTASDALWAGLPVLTRIGETFASRVAASLLSAIGLPELITRSRDEYTSQAVELATNKARRTHIKQKLESNRLTTPLFNTSMFTRHIEAAYTQMYERYQADLPPAHIIVDG